MYLVTSMALLLYVTLVIAAKVYWCRSIILISAPKKKTVLRSDSQKDAFKKTDH